MRDGSGDPQEGLEWVREVWDGSVDPRGGLEWVGDSRVGLGRIGGPSGRAGTGWGPSVRSRMGRWNLGGSGTGWGTLGQVWNGSRDPRGGPRRVGDHRGGTGRIGVNK